MIQAGLEGMPTPTEHYDRFHEFTGARVLNLPPGSMALHVQAFPGRYPFDKGEHEDPATVVDPEYTKFVKKVRDLGSTTARLVVARGTQLDNPLTSPKLSWWAEALAPTQDAGEQIHVAWLDEQLRSLNRKDAVHNPFWIDYFRGVASGDTPRASLWSLLPPDADRRTIPLSITVMNYVKLDTSDEIPFRFEGMDVYQQPINQDLVFYERAWRDVFNSDLRSVPLPNPHQL